MREWILEHYLEVIGALGFGGGGGILSKKILDKQQNKEIKNLKGRMEAVESKLAKNDLVLNNIANSIETNTKFDQQFRDEISSNRVELNRRLDGLEKGQAKMFDYVVQIFKDKK